MVVGISTAKSKIAIVFGGSFLGCLLASKFFVHVFGFVCSILLRSTINSYV